MEVINNPPPKQLQGNMPTIIELFTVDPNDEEVKEKRNIPTMWSWDSPVVFANFNWFPSNRGSMVYIRLNVWMNELTWNWRCKAPTKAGSLQFCFCCFFWWRNAPISWHFRNLVTYGSKSPHVTGTSHAFLFQSQIAATLPTEPYPMQWQCLGLGARMAESASKVS